MGWRGPGAVASATRRGGGESPIARHRGASGRSAAAADGPTRGDAAPGAPPRALDRLREAGRRSGGGDLARALERHVAALVRAELEDFKEEVRLALAGVALSSCRRCHRA